MSIDWETSLLLRDVKEVESTVELLTTLLSATDPTNPAESALLLACESVAALAALTAFESAVEINRRPQQTLAIIKN